MEIKNVKVLQSMKLDLFWTKRQLIIKTCFEVEECQQDTVVVG